VVETTRDGSGKVTVVATADKDLMGRAGSALSDLRFDDVRSAGWTVEGPTPTPDGGLGAAFTKTFATQAEADRILAEISGPTGPLHDMKLEQKRAFAKVTTKLTGSLGLDGGAEGLGDEGLTQLLGGKPFAGMLGTDLHDQLVVTVTLKGPGSSQGATEATGPMDGATRTPIALQVIDSDAVARKARNTAYLGLAGAIVLALLSLLLLQRRRLRARRRSLVWKRY
jgi:hypothetical protein